MSSKEAYVVLLRTLKWEILGNSETKKEDFTQEVEETTSLNVD